MEVFYWPEQEHSPVQKYLKELAVIDQDAVIEILDQITRLGNEGMVLLAEQPALVKKIRGHKKLFELRVKPHRIAFTTRGNKIWILHIFLKQRNRETKELQTAATRAKNVP